MISKKLLELLVKENVVIDSISLNTETNDIEYRTIVPTEHGIKSVIRHKNIFELAFCDCFAFITAKRYDLLIMDTERFYFSNYGDPMEQPNFYISDGIDKHRLCESAFKACDWFIENVIE